MAATHRLTAEAVFKSYGQKRVLENAVITLQTGEITALLGRNGSGKSTLMQILFGSLQGDESLLRFNDTALRIPFQRSGLVNYLPQKPFLPDNQLAVKACDAFGVDHHIFLLHFPEMEIERGKRISALSGGTWRLLEVYLILCAPVKFSLLDEPFTHIAPLYVSRLQNLIREQKANKGILLSDHQYRLLLEITDKTWLMKEGKSYLLSGEEELKWHGYLRQT